MPKSRNLLALTVTAAAVVALSGTAAEARPAYLGQWTVSDSCTPGESELVITSTKWSSVDFECKIRSVSGGGGSWRFNLHKCQGEGVGKTEKVTVRAKGNSLTQVVDGQSYTLKRCK